MTTTLKDQLLSNHLNVPLFKVLEQVTWVRRIQYFFALKELIIFWEDMNTGNFYSSKRPRSINHFNVYDSVVFRSFTVLCSHHHSLVPELYHHPKGNFTHIKQLSLPVTSSPQALGTHNLLSVSIYLLWMDLSTLDTSYQ